MSKYQTEEWAPVLEQLARGLIYSMGKKPMLRFDFFDLVMQHPTLIPQELKAADEYAVHQGKIMARGTAEQVEKLLTTVAQVRDALDDHLMNGPWEERYVLAVYEGYTLVLVRLDPDLMVNTVEDEDD